MGWVRDRVEDVGDTVEDIVEGVGDVVEDVVDFVEEEIFDPVGDFIGNVGEAIGDGLEGLVDTVDDAIQNPYIRAVASFVYPPAAPYLNAYAKLDSGEDLTAADLVSLGVSSVNDLGGITIDPEIAKAVNTGAQLADGADPVSALVSNYGSDFAKELGLEDQLKNSMTSVVGEDAVNFVDNYMDLNQAAADIVAGEDTNRILANQFGDEIAGYIGSGDPNMTALGYAGIETGIALDNGEDQADALMAGAKEYYDRGGQLPDVGQLAQVAGIEGDFDFDFDQYFKDINIQLPDLMSNFDLPQLADLGVNLGDYDFSGMNFPDLGISFNDALDFGIDLAGMDFSGMDVNTDFGAFSMPELADMGIDLESLNLGDLTLPQGLALAGVASQIANEPGQEEEEVVATLENPLLKKEDEGPLFSRQILESTPIV